MTDELAREHCLRIFRDRMGIRSEDALNTLLSSCRLEEYQQDACVLRAGDRMNDCPFVVAGSFYDYVSLGGGTDVVCCICDEYGEPAVPFSALEDFWEPLQVTMVALEPLTLLLIPTEVVVPLIGSCEELAEIMAGFVGKWNGIHSKMAVYNALPLAKRYEAFRTMYPELFARLPLGTVARLINASAVSLSRVLKG